MTTTESSPPTEFRVVGTRPVRPDGVDKVTGRARFGADYNLPGQLHGKVLRSPHAHAKLVSVDVSKAEKLPGVKAVTCNIPLNMTQKWLGHAQMSTTAIYTDAVGSEEKQLAERMDQQHNPSRRHGRRHRLIPGGDEMGKIRSTTSTG